MGDRLGQQIGNYRLVKLLGKGGFAEVYLGQHVRLASKQAAIKILHLMDVDARKFQEEAETTEKLVHPHIVRLLDFDIEQGTPFLVLDYAPGGSLRTPHPKGSRVPLARVGAYLKELAPALQYAHDQQILHRDIKPDNMLIGRGGELLLSDFGIAVLTQTGRTSLPSAYGIGGTPFYMAPETYRGRPVKESDQYALAVVVYEWLCGSVPFSKGDFIQLGFQHSYEPVPPLREKNPAIPLEVEAVIMKALAKEPKDRFASVQIFVQAFEQACLPALPAEEPQPSQSIQARQAQQERLHQAEENEQAGLAEKVRMHDVTSPMPSQPFAPTTSPHTAMSAQSPVPLEHLSNLITPPIQSEPRRTTALSRPTTVSPPSITTHRRGLSKRHSIVLIGLAILIIGGTSFLYTAVKTNLQAADAQATAIVNTTATAQANATATMLASPNPYGGTLVLDDPLHDNSKGYNWDSLFKDTTSNDRCTFINGTFDVTVTPNVGPDFMTCIARNTTFNNFAFEVQMTVIKGDGGGILFRATQSGEHFYYFQVDLNGSYRLDAFDLNTSNRSTDLAYGTSTVIHPGLNQPNLIAIIARDNTLTLYVNKQLIESVNNSTYSQGAIGVFASDNGHPTSNDVSTEVTFSNAKVWKL